MVQINADALNESLPKKWQVVQKLGQGNQGAVFKGSVAGVPAAIKLFFDDGDSQRVSREVAALTKVACPHLVKVLGSCSAALQERVYHVVAYELLDGGDLAKLCEPSAAPTPVPMIARIGHHISLALLALWEHHVVHRDVKPANIVSTAGNRFVLVDLAFARHLDESTLTETGWTVGTPLYMSPEHKRAWKNLTVASDVYSLAVSLFQLATKRFPPADPSKVADALTAVRKDFPPKLTECLVSMLAEIPYERAPIDDVVQELKRLSEGA